MIEDAIFTQVTTNSAVNAIVGTDMYPEYAPQSVRVPPYLVYKIENAASQVASDGPTGLMSAEVVIACIATTKTVAGQLSAAVQAALDGQLGTWSGTFVQGCFLKEDGIKDGVVTQPSSEEILYYVKELSFEIWYPASTGMIIATGAGSAFHVAVGALRVCYAARGIAIA